MKLKQVLAGVATLATAGAAVLLTAGPAMATNQGTELGVHTNQCTVDWSAKTVLNVHLTNDDAEYPGLMVDLDGQPVDYSNGGYIEEVRPELGGPGIFEITHWYGGSWDEQGLATADQSINWRIPISTDEAISGATVEITLPDQGTNFTLTSGQNIANWGDAYANYTWGDPELSATQSADGLHWTIRLGDLAAGTGVVVQLSGTVDAGTDLAQNVVAEANLFGAYAPGDTDDCATPTSTSGNSSPRCEVDWRSDGTILVHDTLKSESDVTYRDEVVSPELGDPGKLGIDGWGGPQGTATVVNGRFVLATDAEIADVTWVLHFDSKIELDEADLAVANPSPGWRVDDDYPNAVTITSQTWDAAAKTMTYTLDMPAASSIMVMYSGQAAEGSWVSGATFTNTTTVTGTYPGVSCDEPVTPTDPTGTTTPEPTAPGTGGGQTPGDQTGGGQTGGDDGSLAQTGADGGSGLGIAAGAFALIALGLGATALVRRHRLQQ